MKIRDSNWKTNCRRWRKIMRIIRRITRLWRKWLIRLVRRWEKMQKRLIRKSEILLFIFVWWLLGIRMIINWYMITFRNHNLIIILIVIVMSIECLQIIVTILITIAASIIIMHWLGRILVTIDWSDSNLMNKVLNRLLWASF